ncbi:MAG: hypothetical protein O3C48_08325 [Crenarchaeota archaeon]|nr:hypothetical protein [Thermoproteota archaeon]
MIKSIMLFCLGAFVFTLLAVTMSKADADNNWIKGFTKLMIPSDEQTLKQIEIQKAIVKGVNNYGPDFASGFKNTSIKESYTVDEKGNKISWDELKEKSDI